VCDFDKTQLIAHVFLLLVNWCHWRNLIARSNVMLAVISCSNSNQKIYSEHIVLKFLEEIFKICRNYFTKFIIFDVIFLRGYHHIFITCYHVSTIFPIMHFSRKGAKRLFFLKRIL
jgi:hypothetical protein